MAGCLAVVLAAGQGKRLRPLTDARSKPMLPIAGEPMVVRVLEMLARGGVDRFVVVVHPGDHPLVDLLGRPPWAGRVELAYQEQRLGTAHALGCAAPFIRAVDASAFILASCDNVYPDGHVAAMIEQQRERDLDAVLTLMQVQPEVIPTLAVVAVQDGRVTRIVEKPRPEDAPSDLGVPFLYVFSARVLDYLPQVAVSPRGEREVQDALRMLIEEGGVVGVRLWCPNSPSTCGRFPPCASRPGSNWAPAVVSARRSTWRPGRAWERGPHCARPWSYRVRTWARVRWWSKLSWAESLKATGGAKGICASDVVFQQSMTRTRLQPRHAPPENLVLFQGPSGAQRRAGDRRIGYVRRHACLARDELVQSSQQCPSTDHHQAAVDDVRG